MAQDAFSVEGKVCAITGAGKGIGRAIAELFYARGARLALLSRHQQDLLTFRREVGAEDGRVITLEGDVSDERTVERFVSEARGAFSKIDVLVNNAGIRLRKPFLDTTTTEWHQVMNTNLGGTYLCCRAVGRHMIAAGGGKIVNMASVIGTLGSPDVAAYGASKGAIVTLTKCLAVEWARHRINVNAIAPGFCRTSYADAFKRHSALYEGTLQRTPQGQWGSALDVAQACLFLSSDAAAYITGEILMVDGGWSAW